ncbi:MAG TPA: type VI secretion system-associated protein TagF [Rhodanobacter sp.]|nr:type VI secretion system-associated protein TagF [Rhodanobacter sp.]
MPHAAAGFFGKLPSAGDFVQRRLPAGFVDTWDAHFETAVAQSRVTLGGDWHEAYHASPVWRFMLPANVCGASAWAGIMGPGSDRVGRCFPMVIAAAIASDVTTSGRVLLEAAGWFDTAEQMHGAAQADAVGVDEFDAQVAALAGPLDAAQPDMPEFLRGVNWNDASHWRLAMPARADGASFLGSLWTRLASTSSPWCLWWTRGAGRVPASVLITRGLPQAEAYAGFLDASHGAAPWQTVGKFEDLTAQALPASAASAPSFVAAAAEPAASWLPDDPELFSDVVAARDPTLAPPVVEAPMEATPTGAAVVVRDRIDDGLTLIAAEAGAGEARQQAVAAVAAIADNMPVADLVQGLSAMRMRIMALNPQLLQTREDLIDPVQEDCAVIATHIAPGQADLLRIGSAAAWHWRNGRLQPLFAASDAIPMDGADAGDIDDLLFSAVPLATPGLGAAEQPACSEVSCAVGAGDRLLLMATQPLLQLSHEVLARSLALPSCDDARSRIASAAGLGDDPARWPLALIEVNA